MKAEWENGSTKSVSVLVQPDRNRSDKTSSSNVPQWILITLILIIVSLIVSVCVLTILLVDGTPDARVVVEVNRPSQMSRSAAVTYADETPFSFDDIFDPVYTPKTFTPTWMPGTNFMTYTNDNGDIMKYDAAAKTEEILIAAAVMTGYEFHSLNADGTLALLRYEYIKQWRRSYFAKYKILTIADGTMTDLAEAASLLYASFAPTGTAVSYVLDNNLYYVASPSGTPVQITTDGESLYKFNGAPDWLYEEDVTSSRQANYWSKASSFLGYAHFDDTGIPLEQYPIYGDAANVHNTLLEFTYPKAGDVSGDTLGPTTKVTLHMYEISTGTDLQIPPPASLAQGDHYYTSFSWLDDSRCIITWTDRLQVTATVQVCSFTPITEEATEATMNCVENYATTVSGGWIEAPWADPVPVSDGSAYYTHLRMEVDEATGSWRHLVHVTAPADAVGVVTEMTTDLSETDAVLAVDETNNYVYFYNNGGDATARHLYRATTVAAEDGSYTPECISCAVTECEYVSASFSDSSDYYVLGCLGPEVPRYILMSTIADVEPVDLETNEALKAALLLKQIPTRTFGKIPVGDGAYEANTEEFLPFNHVDGDTYPLLVYVYAGPGSQRVLKTFPMGSAINNWLMYMKSTHRLAVMSVDGRGTGGRGTKYMYELYKKFGTVEVDDQLTAGEYWRSQNYVNSDENSLIFGWSYGGQTTSHIAGRAQETFKCSIAVAPSTNKAYYDTAYTERFMGYDISTDNAAGYDATAITNFVEQFKDKTYLIAHGTNDDNVHYRHAATLMKALMDAEVQFRQLTYVDEDHSIRTLSQSRHLFQALTNFAMNDCYTAAAPAPAPEPTQGPTTTTSSANGVTSTLVLLATLCFVAIF